MNKAIYGVNSVCMRILWTRPSATQRVRVTCNPHSCVEDVQSVSNIGYKTMAQNMGSLPIRTLYCFRSVIERNTTPYWTRSHPHPVYRAGAEPQKFYIAPHAALNYTHHTLSQTATGAQQL